MTRFEFQSAARPTAVHGRHRRRAFTLTELLVVISIIVLMLAMAVPMFSIFSGSRSIEGAQNTVSAMLQRARARAIGMQERRGVFFFEDQATKKAAMLLVKVDEPVSGPNSVANVIELDDPEEDMQLLPTGVGTAFVLGVNVTGYDVNAKTNYNLGVTKSDQVKATTYRNYGLIVFDGSGRIVSVGSYTTDVDSGKNDVKQRYPPNAKTQLIDRFNNSLYLPTQQHIGVASNGPQECSQAGLLLYDKPTFANLPPVTDSSGNVDPRVFSTAQSAWLDQNGVAVVVNRYNGTLVRGE
ncbi:MAG TPA: prepilin-type N-terminal cleavage/methylation domain-containing protein [Tepidisphaeraceae bacterium]|jgi:prepilin-type N-terminal cleavage/methylation domain-containing protein